MKFVPEAVTKMIAHNALLAQKGSPKMLFAAGMVGMVGSTVLACRATLKMDEVVGEAKGKLDMAKTLEHEDYSEKDRQRDISLIYFQTSVKVARLYLPAVIVGGASIAALTYSHNILTRRNAALMAAYSALDKGFREYRTRVIAKYGEDEDRNLRYGTREIEVVDPETNKKQTVTRVAPGDPSIYAKFFDSYSTSWSKDPEYNLYFLKCQQNWANDLLHSRGHVFLNEVYDMLKLDRTKAGAVVGWILSRNGETDNHISFGIFDGKTQVARDFVNGFEGAILLDFNVDGVIYDKIEK
jgi:Family of unknown function (DUF6353)